MKKQKRVRVTLSVSEETMQRLDSRRKKGMSRSAAAELMLWEGIKELERRELDEEIRAYYAKPQTADELSLTKGLGKVARQLVIDEPEKKRRAR
jgi:hypothetical protein